jgi:hypothetical protein
LPEEAYARSIADDRPWTTKYKDLGTRFPHPIVGGAKEPSKAYYDAMMWTPFGDLLLDFIKAAIEGENLGNNPAGVPDILAISWTSTTTSIICSARRAGSRRIKRFGSIAFLRNCSIISTGASACRMC